MRHFLKIADNVDVGPIMASLSAKPHLWNANDLRTTYPGSPHAEADDIWCLFNDPTSDVMNGLIVQPYDGWNELPIRDIVLNLMRRVNGVHLGRVVITRLAPGKKITPHVDEGAPVEYFSRYQIVLRSRPGSIMQIGEEVIQFADGECWWIDNRAEHSVTNNSDDDRIVMIVDIRLC